MPLCDADSASYYHWHGSSGNHADQIFAFSCVSCGQADAELCKISWKSAAPGSIWLIDYLLPKEREHFEWEPRDSRIGRDRFGDTSPFMEAEYAAFYCRGNCVLYASGSTGFLNVSTGLTLILLIQKGRGHCPLPFCVCLVCKGKCLKIFCPKSSS